jgi:hypothetical protein
MDLIPQPPIKITSLEDTVIHLADEGVPVLAIARATHTPSSEVYELLRDALDEGNLIELPQSDWPPGSLRRSRQPSEQNILNMDDDVLQLACGQIFGLTRQQAAVFVAIIRKAPEVSKKHVHSAIESVRPANAEPTSLKMTDVVIHHIRSKIIPYGLDLKTQWGKGYSFSFSDRDKALALLDRHLRPPQQAA